VHEKERLRVKLKFGSKGEAGVLGKDSDPDCPTPSVFIQLLYTACMVFNTGILCTQGEKDFLENG
jgi:hypothetical protein